VVDHIPEWPQNHDDNHEVELREKRYAFNESEAL
jgi:hypothetical protein